MRPRGPGRTWDNSTTGQNFPGSLQCGGAGGLGDLGSRKRGGFAPSRVPPAPEALGVFSGEGRWWRCRLRPEWAPG